MNTCTICDADLNKVDAYCEKCLQGTVESMDPPDQPAAGLWVPVDTLPTDIYRDYLWLLDDGSCVADCLHGMKMDIEDGHVTHWAEIYPKVTP